MRTLIFSIIVLFTTLCSGCNQNDLEILRGSPFTLTLKPLPFTIQRDETVPLDLRIRRERFFLGTKYRLSWRQVVGQGAIKDEHGTDILPGKEYDLTNESFTLHYTSYSDTEHLLDLTVIDNFGQEKMVRAKLGYEPRQGK